MFGTHIAIYLTNAGNTRTPLHENSPNQVTNSETSPGPPPATAVHPSRGPCPGRKSTVNFPTSLTLPDCRYPLPTAIPKHPEPPPLKTAACHGGLPFCPFPGRSLIFCHVYCPPDENWTEFLTFQIRTESAEAAESGGAGQEGKQPGAFHGYRLSLCQTAAVVSGASSRRAGNERFQTRPFSSSLSRTSCLPEFTAVLPDFRGRP